MSELLGSEGKLRLSSLPVCSRLPPPPSGISRVPSSSVNILLCSAWQSRFFNPRETRTTLACSRTSLQGTSSSCTQEHQPFICPLQGRFSAAHSRVDVHLFCSAGRLQKRDKQRRFHIAEPEQLCGGLITDCLILFSCVNKCYLQEKRKSHFASLLGLSVREKD